MNDEDLKTATKEIIQKFPVLQQELALFQLNTLKKLAIIEKILEEAITDITTLQAIGAGFSSRLQSLTEEHKRTAQTLTNVQKNLIAKMAEKPTILSKFKLK